MPITMGGLSSGVDTQGIIQKLMEVEARPIQQWEEDRNWYNKRKTALGAMSTVVRDLNGAASELYGFRASYHDKKALSSNTGIVDALAGKEAEEGVRKVEVVRLAGSHKISTDPIDQEEKLPAGKFTFTINNEAHHINFRGGSLKALQERIIESVSDWVSTNYINPEGTKHIIPIESKTTGRRGEINISGDKEFLKKIGLIKGVKSDDKEKVTLQFDEKYFTAYTGEKKIDEQDGSFTVEGGGASVKVNGMLWREYVLPSEVPVKDDTLLSFNFAYTARPEEKDDALPYRMEIGPDEKINIKGIELKGYNVPRVRPLNKKPPKPGDDASGIGVVSMDGGVRTEKLYPIDRKATGVQEIPVGRDFKDKKIAKIIVYANDGTSVISNGAFTTPLKDKGFLEPKNEIKKAGDAELKVDGVPMVRDKNEGISDVIKGLTLNLRSASKETVTINITNDLDNAVKKIKAFVEKYNKYLEVTNELTKAERAEKAGDYKKNRAKNGLFIGDMGLLRLENSLKTAVTGAYPSRAEVPVKVFSQLGVSTGAVNAEWSTIKDGKLVMDEDALRKALKQNPEGAKDFFGSDTDGDNRIDNGMAFTVAGILKPYVMTGKNIIQAKMDLETASIKNTDEKIERLKDHLRRHEDKLRTKFAAMEKALNNSKSQGKWLNQQMGGGDGEGKRR